MNRVSTIERVKFRTLSRQEIDALQDEARHLQARAVQDGVIAITRGTARAGRWIWSGLRGLARSFEDAQTARRRYEELSRLSDRSLADMGLTRGDIPAVVAGTFRREADDVAHIRREIDVEADQPITVEQDYREAA